MSKNIEKSKRRIYSALIYIILNIAIDIGLVIAMTVCGLTRTHFLIIFGAQCAINIILIINYLFPRKFKTENEPKMMFMTKHGSLAATLMCCCFAICVGSQIYDEISTNKKMERLDEIKKSLADVSSEFFNSNADAMYEMPDRRYMSFDRQLTSIKYALRVDSNYAYYADITKNLDLYLDALTDSAFIGNDKKESLKKFNRYADHVDKTIEKIKASRNSYYVSYDISSIKKSLRKRRTH